MQRYRLRAVGKHADDFSGEGAFRDRVHQRLQVAAAPGGEDGDSVGPGVGGRGAGSRRTVSRCGHGRSEEHTSELQSLMRIAYAVFCLKQKTTTHSLTANIQAFI